MWYKSASFRDGLNTVVSDVVNTKYGGIKNCGFVVLPLLFHSVTTTLAVWACKISFLFISFYMEQKYLLWQVVVMVSKITVLPSIDSYAIIDTNALQNFHEKNILSDFTTYHFTNIHEIYVC